MEIKISSNMKRILMVLAATVICGACLFTSCKKDEDNDLKLEENIIGKWITTDKNGQSLPTNKKTVYTFVSQTKALVSSAITSNPEIGKLWCDEIEADVAIDGNKMTLTSHPYGNTTVTEVFNLTDINATEFTTNYKTTIMVDGNVVNNEEMVLRFTKLTADYSAAILGLWECTELTGIETFNDANARLEFFADGTYNYWRKNDGGEWEAGPTASSRTISSTAPCWPRAGRTRARRSCASGGR